MSKRTPLTPASVGYVDRQVEAVREGASRQVEAAREDARSASEDVVRQLRELSSALSRSIDVLASHADAGDRSVGHEVGVLRGLVEELSGEASWARERITKARDATDVADLHELVKELGDRITQVEKRAQPVIETLGRLGPGGGFFSAKPGVDMVPVGDANGQWSLVDKATLGGGGGGGAPTGADYLVGTAQAGLSAEIVVGATPGGELGGTWAAPTVDAVHSGSSHATVQAAAEATAAAALAAHTGDASDAHDASAISILDVADDFTATDVEGALAELQADAEVDAAALVTHEADTTSVHGVADTSTLYRSGGSDVAVADGGTGASTAAGARTNLDVPSNAEAVLDSVVDAKGDLIVGTGADAVARLAVGAEGTTPVSRAAATTGIAWETPAAGGGVGIGMILALGG